MMHAEISSCREQFTGPPQDSAKDPIYRRIVRSKATRFKRVDHRQWSVSRLNSPSSDQKNYIAGRFRVVAPTKVALKDMVGLPQVINRVAQDERTSAESDRPTQEIPPVTTLNLPPLDPFITSLGPHAWELLHHCSWVFNSEKLLL